MLFSSLGSLSLLCFYLKVKPLESTLSNSLEIMNETTVFILFTINYLFTDYISSQELKYLIGWGFIGILILNLAINWIIIVIFSVLGIIQFVREKWRKRK